MIRGAALLSAAALLAALLGGCGFALRGQTQLPPAMGKTALSGVDRDSPLLTELRLLLRGHGVELVDAADASARLSIGYDRLAREVQSVSATARVREFALRYTVAFTLEDPIGAALIPPQSIELVRDYTFDQSEVLSAASEEEFLRTELTREMAREILARIELAAR